MSHGYPSGCKLGRIDSIHSREDDDQNKSPQAGAPIKRFNIKLVFQISTKTHPAVPLINAKSGFAIKSGSLSNLCPLLWVGIQPDRNLYPNKPFKMHSKGS